jgi:phospholipase/carboxylesterase
VSKELECLCYEPPSTHTATVIWMHGLGASGDDFVPVMQALSLPKSHGIRFIFPHAPEQAVSLNGGMVMPAWFDIFGLQPGAPVDTEGMRRTELAIRGLMESEIQQGVPVERIVLAGFSQGAVMALHIALGLDKIPAGVMALSGFLAPPTTDLSAKGLPIFMAHGVEDAVISLDYGHHSRDHLNQLGAVVEWHEYTMGHAVCDQEIIDISTWLKRILPELA